MDKDKFLKSLTLKEKCAFLAQQDGFVGKVDRIIGTGIKPLDNPRGGDDYYRLPEEACTSQYHPVCFPSMTNIGMTWNKDMAYQAGVSIAKECKSNSEVVSWIFRPGINIKRSPLCGRNFEYVSEDPILSGAIGGHYIKGVQSQGVGACAKHYAVNHQEYQRMTMNAVVSERALKEIYLKSFEEAFMVEKPWSVMTAYNKVNGKWVNSSPELMGYLRNDLQYDGLVVSDWAAVHEDKVAAHLNGMDVETAPVECHSAELEQGVLDGDISESYLDQSIKRVLSFQEKVEGIQYTEVDMEELHEQSIDMARDSIVLLRNEENVLPLASDDKILVVGQLANSPVIMGYGSGHMNGYRTDIPFEKIKNYNPNVQFTQGYEQSEGAPAVYLENSELVEEAVQMSSRVDKVIIFAGYAYSHETEGRDREDILLPKSQRVLIEALLEAHRNVSLVITSGSAVDIGAFNNRLKGVVFTGLAGEGYGTAIADILFGTSEPGGRLAETFPVRLEDTPSYLSFTAEGEDTPNVFYGEDIFVGYRYYDKKRMDVLYPFGHGLSYTEFSYEMMGVEKRLERIIVAIKVSNTGALEGSTVIQLYTGKKGSKFKRSQQELKGFEKVTLSPGETKEIRMEIPISRMKIFSESQKDWVLEGGIYQLYLATSSRERIFGTDIEITSEDVNIIYDEMTPLGDYLNNTTFRNAIEQHSLEASKMMDQRFNPHLPLIAALPIYRLTEPLAGKPLFTKEMLQGIIKLCNEVGRG